MPPLTHMERVAAAVSHREADRVPFVLSVTLLGAKHLGLVPKAYFGRAEHVVEGQLRLWRRYGHDALAGFLHSALEYEAWGGEAVFAEDGPPTSGPPVFRHLTDLDRAEPPAVDRDPGLQRALEVIRQLRAQAGGEVPILGLVVSPFSLPVMQLGFETYLDLIYEDRVRFRRLMAINQAFATAWGSAQLAAGATGLVYADPLASPSMVPVECYRETGLGVAQETLASFPVPPFIHLASGRTLGVLDLLAGTGTPGIGVSCEEDLAEVKRRCAGRLAVIGNLNGIAMASWSQDQTALEVKRALAKGAPGGGFILSDTHGELPWGVPEDTLGTIAETVRTWGAYPLRGEGHG